LTLYDYPAPAVRIINDEPPERGAAKTRRSAVLIVTRKPGQAVRIGEDIRVVLMESRGKQVRIGIEAPDDVQLYREEITEAERAQYRIHADDEGEG